MEKWEEPLLKEWPEADFRSHLAEADLDLEELLSPLSVAYMRGMMALERIGMYVRDDGTEEALSAGTRVLLMVGRMWRDDS
jgi:hypothetical protein